MEARSVLISSENDLWIHLKKNKYIDKKKNPNQKTVKSFQATTA